MSQPSLGSAARRTASFVRNAAEPIDRNYLSLRCAWPYAHRMATANPGPLWHQW
jgi:hypothetical protein